MTMRKKMLIALAAQINQNTVTLPAKPQKPQKITDDNQAISNGVIHEKPDSSLRSTSSTSTKRGRSRKPKRED